MAFPIGRLVRITGLVSKPEYNGKLATVAEFSATTGRIRVSLEDGKGGVFEARVPRNPREADANVARQPIYGADAVCYRG